MELEMSISGTVFSRAGSTGFFQNETVDRSTLNESSANPQATIKRGGSPGPTLEVDGSAVEFPLRRDEGVTLKFVEQSEVTDLAETTE